MTDHAASNSGVSLLVGLYRDHFGWLQGWVSRRVGCKQQASDVAQATFCRLIEIGAVEPPRAPRAFLATVARRLLIDDVRRRDIERVYLESAATAGLSADELTPERIAEACQMLERVLTLLAALPAPVRRAFVLRCIDGLSHDEIAVRLGVSARTVKRHIAQAYARFYVLAYGEEGCAS